MFSHPEQSSQILRVDPATVIVFAVLLSPILVGGVMTSWRGHHVWEGTIMCAGWCFALCWICSPAIELAPGRLVYRTFFKKRQIDLAAVSSVAISARPAPTLELHRKAGCGAPVTFILKPFSRQSLVSVFRHIRRSNPMVQFDKTSEDMSEGDFRSVTRLAVSTESLLRLALVIAAIGIGGAVIRLLLHR